MTLLEFEIDGRRLGLPASLLREAIRAVATSPLPDAPPIVEGVINYRGTLVAVLGVRQRFGLAPLPLSPDQHFLIVELPSRPVALRVDRALGLITVDPATIVAADQVTPGAKHIAGIATLPDGLVVIQDLAQFLSLEEVGQITAALTAVPA